MRQLEQYETDSEGNRIYAVGHGEMTPGGVGIMFSWTHIDPHNEAIVHKQQGDGERIYLYRKSTVNKKAVAEILLSLKHTKGAITVSGSNSTLTAVRVGRTRWTHILRFYGYCIGMGDRMYKAVLDAINADEGLKQRLVIT